MATFYTFGTHNKHEVLAQIIKKKTIPCNESELQHLFVPSLKYIILSLYWQYLRFLLSPVHFKIA